MNLFVSLLEFPFLDKWCRSNREYIWFTPDTELTWDTYTANIEGSIAVIWIPENKVNWTTSIQRTPKSAEQRPTWEQKCEFLGGTTEWVQRPESASRNYATFINLVLRVFLIPANDKVHAASISPSQSLCNTAYSIMNVTQSERSPLLSSSRDSNEEEGVPETSDSMLDGVGLRCLIQHCSRQNNNLYFDLPHVSFKFVVHGSMVWWNSRPIYT